MLENLSIFEIPYKEFLKYLFINVFKKDKEAYKNKVRKIPDNIIIIRGLEFLEKQYNVPILEALSYYYYKEDVHEFNHVLQYTLRMEFQRIQLNKECNYIPF